MSAADSPEEWRKVHPFPAREVRAREAVEIAYRSGLPEADIQACYAKCGLPAVFVWPRLTDAQLANLSATLRIAAGFY